jgi:3-hydroxyisobutyrate dehydrogenase-like beta-hydroxyacid dehydrogenase
MNTKVGIVGLGIMGGAYARNLRAKGFPVVGYDVDAAKMKALAEVGVEPASSPADVARKADRLITSLPSGKALMSAAAGPGGIAEAGRPVVVADTCTLALADKEAARAALQKAGQTLLDCPVSGTGAQAAKGDLVVFASGPEAAAKSMDDVFAGIGRKVHYLGAFGNGSRMKYIANLLVAIHNVSAGEAFAFGQKSGIAPETIYAVLADSAATSRMFQVRGTQMVEGVYDRDVTATHRTMAKDISIITQHAQSIDCATPLFSLAANIHAAAIGMGYEMSDTASVCAVLEKMAGVSRSS